MSTVAENAFLCVKIVQSTANRTHRDMSAQSILVLYWSCIACCTSLCCWYIQSTVKNVSSICDANSSWVDWKSWSANSTDWRGGVEDKVRTICQFRIRYLLARASNKTRIANCTCWSELIIDIAVDLISLKSLNTNSLGICTVRTDTNTTETTVCIHC